MIGRPKGARGMNKILRNSLIGVGAVVVLVAAAPFLVPLDAYRNRIESAALGATGRDFRIDGPLRLTFFPHFGVRANDVTLANVPGGRARVMVAVGDINLSIKVLPLLTGRVALDKIVLNQPTIALEVDRDGNPNWKFGKATATEAGATKKGSLTLPAGTEFSGITVNDGRVTYDNAKTKTHRALDHVTVVIDITTADRPIAANGAMSYAGRAVSFTAHLATLKTFLGAGTTTFDLKADADLMHASLQGRMLPDGTTAGTIGLNSPSFRNLAAWLGSPLPGGGLGALSLSAAIANKDKVTDLNNLAVTLDGQTIKGHLVVDASAPVPMLGGNLAIDHLDINPYVTSSKGEPAGPHPASGWSRKPISLAILKEFNCSLVLTTGALRARGLTLGATQASLENHDGRANIALARVSLYGGTGSADLTIDVRGREPLYANTMAFSNVALKPLLSDALGLSTIEGTGALKLDITMSGTSPSAMLHSLAGKGSITGSNGRFKGVDLGAVARSVHAILGGDAASDTAATAFHQMGASFILANGVLRTDDFRLDGPLVEMTGRGDIDIGERTIALKVKPEASYGGYGIGVPFRVTGSWDKLHYAPDLDGIMGGVVDSLKNGGNALDNLLGRHNPPADSDNSGQKRKKNLGDRLKSMFGIH
jgi:AsmA protein